MLTQKQLKRLLSYNPETGEWRWLVSRPGGKRRAGEIAGYRLQTGYWFIGICRERHLSHRLAWLYMTGSWPRDQIDHIDRNPANNKWSNLRESDQSENMINCVDLPRDHRRRKYGGLRGTKFVPSLGKWMGRIHHKRHETYLGLFDTAEEAHAAYVEASKKMYGEFARQ